jgi:hypothetical protein
MAHYKWSEDYCLDELDGAKGWQWYNFALEHEDKLHGCGIKTVGPSYIQKQKAKILAQK